MNKSLLMKSSQVIAVSLAAGLLSAATPATAQTFPDKVIRVVVPAGAGGNLDIVARIAAEGMSRDLGVARIIIDNQSGGRQIPGTAQVARAKPDGYTLLAAGVSFSVNAALYDDLPFDAVKDFTAVGLIGDSPLLITASSSFPANNIKELVALAKAKPDTYNYASTGVGSPAHIAGEMLNNMAGIRLTHVSYKDTRQANVDNMSGVVHLFLPSASSVVGLIKSGKLKALGMASPKRSPQLPGIPAIAETLPGFELTPWNGTLAPAGTPRAVIVRLNTALNKGLAIPEIKEKLLNAGVDISPQTPEQTTAFIENQIKKFAKLTKDAGIQGER